MLLTDYVLYVHTYINPPKSLANWHATCLYTFAEYLTIVTDPKIRKSLTRYRLSEHSLAIEKGCHRQTWLYHKLK